MKSEDNQVLNVLQQAIEALEDARHSLATLDGLHMIDTIVAPPGTWQADETGTISKLDDAIQQAQQVCTDKEKI